MNKISQKCAVYAAVINVLKENNIMFEDGMDAKVLLSTDMRKSVSNILMTGFTQKTISLESDQGDKLKSYVSGLISNHLRKDVRLNGGGKYETKNPGSRSGSTDPELKNLMALMTTLSDGPDREEVAGYIKARKVQLETDKTKSVTIDYSKLPEALKAKYTK